MACYCVQSGVQVRAYACVRARTQWCAAAYCGEGGDCEDEGRGAARPHSDNVAAIEPCARDWNAAWTLGPLVVLMATVLMAMVITIIAVF